MKRVHFALSVLLGGVIGSGVHDVIGMLFPPPPFIEIIDAVPQAEPVRAGGVAAVSYTLRRNSACPTAVHRRWFNVDTGTFSTIGRVGEAVQADVTEGFIQFQLALDVPAGLPPGRWAYAPKLVCDDTGEEVLPPRAVLTVVGP